MNRIKQADILDDVICELNYAGTIMDLSLAVLMSKEEPNETVINIFLKLERDLKTVLDTLEDVAFEVRELEKEHEE